MNAVIVLTGLVFDMDLAPQQREYFKTIRHRAEAMGTFVNNALESSKIGAAD